MKKKLFIGSPLNQEIAETIKQGHEQAGEINVEHIPLKRIDVDQENPRRTGFDSSNILNPEETILGNPNKQKIYDGLLSLSTSIASVGVQQPIKVYRHKDRFRIAFGERRYLASILANKETIPAWILYDKPQQLRSIQYIENMQREDLTTWERIQNVQSIINENSHFENKNEMPPVSVTALSELTGMSRSRASHYLSILNGPEDVKSLIERGDINNLEKGGYLSRIDDDQKRKMAIKLILDGQDAKEIDRIIYSEEEKKVKSTQIDTRGRPRTSVNLGKTTKIEIIRKIMTSIPIKEGGLLEGHVVDWSDVNSVTQHWKIFLKALEMEL
ncbi:MAG: ParB/RepB/Spo0J family partition protein [Candidatus Paceibacterota bacterium]|jgi:ParB family chromosome partitioning protein